MKPLLKAVVALSLLLTIHALPENIEDVKELPQAKDLEVEAEESNPQARVERCTTCGTVNLGIKSPKQVLAALRAIPGATVHTQQSFEGCSSDKGCAGLKVKDGKIIERFGNLDAYKAAAAADVNNEFIFHAGGFGSNAFEGGLAGGNAPFWWMNQDSPFKNAGAGGSYEKFSKSSSSSYSSDGTTGAGVGAIGAGVGAIGAGVGAIGAGGVGLDLAANPFLNGDFSKLGAAAAGASASELAASGVNPSFQSSSFESQSSYSSSNNGEVDLSKNPFLNGGFKAGQAGFQAAQGSQVGANAFGANAFGANAFGANAGIAGGKVGTGYTGSSPAPFAATGSNVNLVQNAQKSEFDFEQQQQTQQNIDELFQGSTNIGLEASGGDLQQTCAGNGYACVLKSQCNNGVVNTNGAGLLQARTKKQYCNVRTEICCRIEVTGLAGAGLQGTLQGIGNTFASNQGFAGQSASSLGAQTTSTIGAAQNGFSQTGTSSFGAKGTYGAGSSFGSAVGSANRGVESTKFGTAYGSTLAPTTKFGAGNSVYKTTSQSNFIETDSYSSGSENNGVYRPGAVGTVLKPGIPYLPPVDNTNSGTNVVVSSTALPTPPLIVTTPRPVTIRPTYLPPVTSTSAPGYLPPIGEQTINRETIVPPNPTYIEGQIILDENRLPRPKIPVPVPVVPNDIPAGCAAALKCTPIEFCTAEGIISNTTVILTREQDAYRVPLTDCRDVETGRIGKCCRDPFYTDPWPTNQLGKWVPGVFGGNDGKYVPDSRVSSNNIRPTATVRPPVTGSVILNNFLTPKPTVPAFGPSTITPIVQKGIGGQGQYGIGSRGQVGIAGQGQFGIAGQGSQFNTAYAQGQRGQGQIVTQGRGQVTKGGQGAILTQGQGQVVRQGQGQIVTQGRGQYAQGGRGQVAIAGQGQLEVQGQGGQFAVAGQKGFGQTVVQGQGLGVIEGQGIGIKKGQGAFVTQGQGQSVSQGQGQFGIQGQGAAVSQGFGTGIRQGQGQIETQGQGAVVSQGFGTGIRQGQGQYTTQGQSTIVSQGFGQGVRQGQGQLVSQGQGEYVSQGQGLLASQGFGQNIRQGAAQIISQTKGQLVTQGKGQIVTQGQGQGVSQGFGQSISQGGGISVSQGGGIGVENEYSESVRRVFLQQYSGSGQCGLFNGQRPYGNRNDLEVDFAEIPWQAMVLLQTNKSLLCGGVITRPDVVVTSAACVEGLDAKNVLIKGGEWKLGIDDEPLPFQIVQVKTIVRHPFYKPGSLLYDAAILVLAENLRFAKNIYPICLPRAEDTLDAFYNGAGECIVTGWGKQVLQAHLAGAIMHSMNVSLISPGECQAKLSSDYPHLLEHYNEDSCACGQPTNPLNNICRVDIGSALACTTGNGQFVLRGVYSWDSGCQIGNQIAGFYKFDLEWYEWAIGLIESVRFAQFSTSTKVTSGKFSGQINGGQYSGVKGVKGSGFTTGSGFSKSQFGFGSTQGQYSSGVKNFAGKITASSQSSGGFGTGFNLADIKPITNGFSATYSEKKVYQTEPKIITYTTKPEIVTFTTKPEIFTYTTKPKIVTYTTKPKIITYTTKPQIITYETSGSGNNPQYAAPGVTFNPSFSELVGSHSHTAACKCLEGKK